jgi:O-antigen/teichoic acid export membrane protein
MAGNTISLSLAATDRQKARTFAVLGAAVLNVGLNLYFIPRWSYLGAAETTVICETGVLIAYSLILRRVTGPFEFQRAHAWPALGCIPLAGAVLLTRGHPWPLAVAAGAVAYGVAILLLALFHARASGHRSPLRALATLLEPSR